MIDTINLRHFIELHWQVFLKFSFQLFFANHIICVNPCLKVTEYMHPHFNYHLILFYFNWSYFHLLSMFSNPNSCLNYCFHLIIHFVVVSFCLNKVSYPKVFFSVLIFLFTFINKFLIETFLLNLCIDCLLIFFWDELFRISHLIFILIMLVSEFFLWIIIESFILMVEVAIIFYGFLTLIIEMFSLLLYLIHIFCCYQLFFEIIFFHLMSYLYLAF